MTAKILARRRTRPAIGLAAVILGAVGLTSRSSGHVPHRTHIPERHPSLRSGQAHGVTLAPPQLGAAPGPAQAPRHRKTSVLMYFNPESTSSVATHASGPKRRPT